VASKEMSTSAAQAKSILRNRTTSEGDALKAPRGDDDIASLIGGGWKSLGLDCDDDDAIPSVMSAQVAVVKEFDTATAKDINSFKKLGAKKVEKKKYGGGPCLFGQGKVPVPESAAPVQNGSGGSLANVKVNMEDPSTLLKDSSGAIAAPAGPVKQLPMPPLLRKKSLTPGASIGSALQKAMSQPGSRAASRPESPSRMLSLPPETPQQANGTSDLLSMAAQGLQSSFSAQSNQAHQQASTFQGISTEAMSQIAQNTTVMQSTSAVKQSTWGFTAADTTQAVLTGCNGLTNGVAQSPTGFKPLSKSKSVSALTMETSFEINDPKPMEQAKSASFKPLEPSHQTHNAKIVVPKPVSPPHGKSVDKRSAPPPVESRASVLAPAKGSSQSQQIGCKQTDYSYYLDLINDGAEEVSKEKASPVAPPRTRQVTGTVATDEAVSKNAVKSAKSIFEGGSNLVKKQETSMSKSCSNLSQCGKSTYSSSSISKAQVPKPNVQSQPQPKFNEPKLDGTEAARAALQLKVQSQNNLASLLAKDEMQSSLLISADGFDQNEETVIKESLVQNVKATSAKWNQSIKKEDKVITFGNHVNGNHKQENAAAKSLTSSSKSYGMTSKANHATTTTSSASANASTKKSSAQTFSSGIGLTTNLQSVGGLYSGGNPEELLLRAIESGAQMSNNKQVQSQCNHSHQVSNRQSQSIHSSAIKEVLEQQVKIEMERQKQIEYETNQRKGVVEKRTLAPLQAEENELSLQLERRRIMEIQKEEERKRMEEEERQRILNIQRQEEQRRIAEAEKLRAIEIQRQEEERRKVELEKKRILEIQRQEEEKRRAEAERQRLMVIQRQEEERKKVEAERQRLLEVQRQEEERRRLEAERQRQLEIQRQEEERKRAEAEQQRLLEIQRQEEERRRAEAEQQRLLEIQRQEEERRRAEAEQQRMLESQRQEEERRRAEEAERQRQEQERQKIEEQKRAEEESQRKYEEEQREQFKQQQLVIQMEANRKHQESQFQLEQQLEQQRVFDIQSLKQSGNTNESALMVEKQRGLKLHEEQLRLLREKQEEEQRQLLLLHQQEEALWESKRSFIQKSRSVLEAGKEAAVESSHQNVSAERHTICRQQSAESQLHTESVTVHEAKTAVESSVKNETRYEQNYSQASAGHMYQVKEAMSANAGASTQASDVIEYSAPVIHNGSRPTSAQSLTISSLPTSPTGERASQEPPTPAVVSPQIGSRLSVSQNPTPVTPEIKMNVIDDPLSFLLSSQSPVSVCSSVVSSAAPSPAPSIPSAPAPPPVQPSYATIATGDAINELRAKFNETPVQTSFNDPIVPSLAAVMTAHNPPSKMQTPPAAVSTAHNPPSKMQPAQAPHQPAQAPPQPRMIPSSPNASSSRPEVVSPNTQRKRLMAQCMAEAAGSNKAMLPSQVKAAKRKTTKSRVERFIEATCVEPQTVVRKTASGQEYYEVISPESTELARSILEPPASR